MTEGAACLLYLRLTDRSLGGDRSVFGNDCVEKPLL